MRLFSLVLTCGLFFGATICHAAPPKQTTPLEKITPDKYTDVYKDLSHQNENTFSSYKDKHVTIIGTVVDTNTSSYNGPLSNDKNGTKIYLKSDPPIEMVLQMPGKFKQTILKLNAGQDLKVNGVIKGLAGNTIIVNGESIELIGSIIQQEPPQKSPIKISANELYRDYEPDWIAGENKWFDKIVEISGPCLNRVGSHLMLVKSQNGIHCIIPNSFQNILNKIQAGQCVTVIGKIDHYTAGNIIINVNTLSLCSNQISHSEQLLNVSADDLYNEYQSNPNKAKNDYQGKTVSIHGNLFSLLIQSGGTQKLILTPETVQLSHQNSSAE